MKELLTLKEAASLAGRTTKTIKNYIKQGKITNFFLVEGKFGQEYRISVRDVEPLMKKRGGKGALKTGEAVREPAPAGRPAEPFPRDHGADEIYDRPEYQFLMRRNDELLMELGRYRERAENLERSNLQLRQELEEKNMLISMLMKKETRPAGKD